LPIIFIGRLTAGEIAMWRLKFAIGRQREFRSNQLGLLLFSGRVGAKSGPNLLISRYFRAISGIFPSRLVRG
jgi:hypothetical protein